MELLESERPGQRDIHMRSIPSSGPVEKNSTETERIVRTALIVGGTLAASWLVLRLIQRYGKSNKKTAITVTDNLPEPAPVQPVASSANSVMAAIGDRVAREATIFVLNLAREKIAAWIESKRSADEHP